LDYHNELHHDLKAVIKMLWGSNQEEINFGYGGRILAQHYHKLIELSKTNTQIASILDKGVFEEPIEVQLNDMYEIFMMSDTGQFTSNSLLKHTNKDDDMIGGVFKNGVYYMREFSVGTYTVHGHTGIGKPLFVEILKSLKIAGVSYIAIQNIIPNSKVWWTKLGFTLIPFAACPKSRNKDTKIESIDDIIRYNSI
jgi:hypothetical protein